MSENFDDPEFLQKARAERLASAENQRLRDDARLAHAQKTQKGVEEMAIRRRATKDGEDPEKVLAAYHSLRDDGSNQTKSSAIPVFTQNEFAQASKLDNPERRPESGLRFR